MSEISMLVGVFVVVLLVGRRLIRRIPPLLHTPLMSMTNAVSGVTIVGAILLFRSSTCEVAPLVAALAVGAAAFNLVGGFCVTGRMLGMFRNPSEGSPKS